MICVCLIGVFGKSFRIHYPSDLYFPLVLGKPILLEFVKSAAGGEKRKRTKSEGDGVTFDDIKLGQVYTVTVTSVKAIQLNVQLGKKVVETIHIHSCLTR